MTYNMRLLVGLAVILLMAVVFAQPVLAQGTETYTSIVGMNDITAWITNPSFEANKATAGQYLVNQVNGWQLGSGSSGSATVCPGPTLITGATATSLPIPTDPDPASPHEYGLYTEWLHAGIEWQPGPGNVERRVFQPDPE